MSDLNDSLDDLIGLPAKESKLPWVQALKVGRAEMMDVDAIEHFVLAGNATFTLVSKKTGNRFTYKVRQSEDGKARFASLLNGPDNEGDYAYIGLVVTTTWGCDLKWTAKSRAREDAPSFRALRWFLRHLSSRSAALGDVEFWHEGRCGCCGRKLTVPESIANGIGPICASRGH